MFSNLREGVRNLQVTARLSGWRYAMASLIRGRLGVQIVPKPFHKEDKVVILAPHPDDDVIGCAGALLGARHALVIYVTDGRHGTPSGKPSNKLIKVRQKEASAGLRCLGDKIDTIFLGNSDSSLKPTKAIAKTIANLITDFAKGNIYLFVPWALDDNRDHKAVAQLAHKAIRLMSDDAVKEVWQYEVWSPLIPNRFIPLKGAAIRRKAKAIAAHRSQLKSRAYDKAILGLNAYRGAMAGIDCPAEGYLALLPKEFVEFADRI